MSSDSELDRNRNETDQAGRSSDEEIFANVERIKEILSTNALIAALFLTLEFPLLALDTDGMDDMWKRLLLYTAVAAVVLHTLCVYTAAEFTFVVNQMHQLHSSIRAQHLEKFIREHHFGSRCPAISGFSFLMGIILAGIAQGAVLPDKFGSTDGHIAIGILASAYAGFFLYAFFGIGGMVSATMAKGERIASTTVSTTSAF
eukprot:m.470580 g.470580  ORF g.470580 m.470580 type:complete len:202 (-) comp21652_c0_seq13:2416-3021(-)